MGRYTWWHKHKGTTRQQKLVPLVKYRVPALERFFFFDFNTSNYCELLWNYSEKVMAPCSSTLAWKIPRAEEPGRLQSMGSLRVGHDWATSLSVFTFLRWRRKRQPTPVFLPGESQGRGSLVGCRLWGRRVGHDWSDLAVAVWNYYNIETLP